jgi:hypothetical protein
VIAWKYPKTSPLITNLRSNFIFAWEVGRVLDFPRTFNVLFEVPCDHDENNETIRLDLLMWTNPKASIAIELKAPIRSETGKNSAMTQVRMRFYRDLHRLRHLVESHKRNIVAGYFLAVVNERGYVVERRQRMNAAYRTYDGTVVHPACIIAPDDGPNGYKFPLKMPAHEIRWEWSCESAGNTVSPRNGMHHFWLTPILVRAV